ncbi:MAG: hypothetical protein LBD38_02745 [Streptococcaceae bacterium]|jgi:hypothetical protein|nr:hypothetical protein [Streptococcaceae bacterium]
MGQIISYSLFRALKEKRIWGIALLFLFFSVADILIQQKTLYEAESGLLSQFTTFLSGNSEGHVPQLVSYTLLPIIVSLGSVFWFAQDSKTGNIRFLVTRMSRAKYLFSNTLIIGLTYFFSVLLPLLLNYALVSFLFKNNDRNPYQANLAVNYANFVKQYPVGMWEMNHHVFVNFAYIFVFSVFVALVAIFMYHLTFWIEKWQFILLVGFGVWLICCVSKYSPMNVFQPFAIDSNLQDKITTCILAIFISLFFYISTLIRFKKGNL